MTARKNLVKHLAVTAFAACATMTQAGAQAAPVPEGSVRLIPPVIPHHAAREGQGSKGYKPGPDSTAYDPNAGKKAAALLGIIMLAATGGTVAGHLAGKRARRL